MGKTNRIQNDFTAGEISPRMELQENLEGRKHGVSFMENFFLHLQGTAETSRGTEWIADVVGTFGRMFGFPVSFSENYMVVITDANVLVFDANGLVDSFASVWGSEEALASVQAKMFPAYSSMIITSSTQPPYLIGFPSGGGAWTFGPYPITSPPAEWAASNYPPAVAFFENRMWLGGVESDPTLFWGSKSGDWFDFTTGALADDALAETLGRQGRIRWISGGPGLLIGTSTAEHVISSVGGFIAPGDINSKVQSTNGSFPAQSLEVGNEVMYVSPDGRKLRSIGYEWLKDSWRSRDLTHASEHITKDNEITNLVYMANPDSLIAGITRAGKLIVATYEPYSQTVGFARRSTQGEVISIGAVSSEGSDEMWMLVDRGNGVLHVEKELHPVNTKLDSFTTFSGTAISGGTVPHLATKTCQVLVDGAVHPDVIPDAGGVFTTEYSGSEIQIGLQISSIIITLPVADVAAKVGTTRTMKKRWTEIWVRVLDSWRPKVNGRRTPNRRVPTPMGEVEEARTESFEVSDTGWDQEAKITIEQDLPLRTEVAGWFGRILQEEI